MHSEAKETARLYALLTDKLGSDVTEAMFNYIDNKTVQSVEATIQSLATKNDLFATRDDLRKEIGGVKDDIANAKLDLRKEMGDLRKEFSESRADNIKWMFIFWIGQVGAMLAILLLFLKK
jgi:hypothetical protein